MRTQEPLWAAPFFHNVAFLHTQKHLGHVAPVANAYLV